MAQSAVVVGKSWRDPSIARAMDAIFALAEDDTGALGALASALGADALRCSFGTPTEELTFAAAGVTASQLLAIERADRETRERAEADVPGAVGWLRAESDSPDAGLVAVSFVAYAELDQPRVFLRLFRLGATWVDEGLSDETLLPALGPPLLRALRIRNRLREGLVRTQELAALLEAFPLPALVLDGGARMRLMNEEARARLVGDPRLRLTNGALGAASPRETARLLARIAQMACRPSERTAEALLLRDGGDEPLRLVLSPFLASKTEPALDLGRGRVLAIVIDPATASALDPTLLETLYDLTPTEAALACGLVEGQTVKDLARDRGLSLHTVRTHVKRILDKTGTHRQAELVRILALVACASLPTAVDE